MTYLIVLLAVLSRCINFLLPLMHVAKMGSFIPLSLPVRLSGSR